MAVALLVKFMKNQTPSSGIKLTDSVFALEKNLDVQTLSRLSEQHVDRFVKLIAKTRRSVAEHFQDNLKIPADPCLDILLALQAFGDRSLTLETISEQIFRPVSLTDRYLNIMATEGLIDLDEQSESARLTVKGTQELSYIIGHSYAAYLTLVK